MNKLKENFENIILFLLEIVIGIILLINPVKFTSAIIIIAGIVFIVIGIMSIIKYFKTEPLEALKEQNLSKGLIISAIGLFCVFCSNWFIATFPILSMLYGIVILISGFIKIQWAVDSLRLKKKNWIIFGISALLSIIFGIIIIKNPFSTIKLLWQFTGIILIVEAVLDIVSIFWGGNSVNTVK